VAKQLEKNMINTRGENRSAYGIYIPPNSNSNKTNLKRRSKRPNSDNNKEMRHPQCSRSCLDMNLLSKDLQNISIATSLMNNGICIVDQFLSDEIAKRISRTTQSIFKQIPGLFTEPLSIRTRTKFRHDLTCWIKGTEHFCQCYSEANDLFVKLVKDVLRECNIQRVLAAAKKIKVSHKSKLQISCFPENSSGYLPHADNPKNNGRVLTLVYYPNDKYDAEEYGGSSRFYFRNRTQCVNVEPRNNRLVLYWSDSRVITETLPTRSGNVFALTYWFFGSEH